MANKYPTLEKKPSRMFVDALCGGGSHNMTCGCGRVHYCPDSDNFYHNDGDMEDEENAYKYYLQEALDEQAKDPDGVVIHYRTDCVMAKDLAGITFVIDCPCNGLRRYEDFIWQNRDSIRTYLKTRIDQEFQWAEQERTKNKLLGI